MKNQLWWLLAAVTSLTTLACGPQNDFSPPPSVVEPNFVHNGRVECDTPRDCGEAESCVDGICQLQGCSLGTKAADAPLGTRHYLALKRDLLLAKATVADSYHPSGNAFIRPNGVKTAWSIPNTTLTDIAGGNLLNSRPEAFAVTTTGSQVLLVIGQSTRNEIQIGFVPTAIAAGDTNKDGIDEVIALRSNGAVSICSAITKRCSPAPAFPTTNVQALDVTLGDLDGDFADEVIVLADVDKKRTLIVWRAPIAPATTATVTQIPLEEPITRLAAADLNADRNDELMGLVVGATGKLTVYATAVGKLSPWLTIETRPNAVDVAASDLDGDQRSEIVVLTTAELDRGNKVQVLKQYDGDDFLTEEVYSEIADATAAKRLSLFDLDGDSPSGKLVDGPKLIPGELVPVALLTFPPYSKTYSEGVSGVSLGTGSSSSTGTSSTASLSLGWSASYGIGLGPLFSVSANVGFSKDISRTTSKGESQGIGSSWSLGYRPMDYGTKYAGIVVACGCFTAYTYEMDDPQVPARNGEKFTIYSPTGGQTTLWTTERYNAMIDALHKKLPKITLSHNVGDPSSYPTSFVTLDGNPVRTEDMVFKQMPTHRVADIGQVGWSLSASESQSSSESRSQGLSVGVTLGIAKLGIGRSWGWGWSEGSSVSLGKDISFSGSVPALPDVAKTPEDEYLTRGYAFTPYVYKHKYQDDEGNAGAFFVLQYMIRP